jgi:hypothetical protein
VFFKKQIMLFFVYMLYFGALIIPAAYLFGTRWRGPLKRPMLAGAALQILFSLAVWAFVYYSWRQGYEDSYYGWALLLPVNVVGLVYYLVTLFVKRS